MRTAVAWHQNPASWWDTNTFFGNNDGDIYDEAQQIFQLASAIYSGNPLLSNSYDLAAQGMQYLDNHQEGGMPQQEEEPNYGSP